MMLMFIQSISNEIVPMQCTFNYRMSAGALKTDSRFTVSSNRTVPSVILYYIILYCTYILPTEFESETFDAFESN